MNPRLCEGCGASLEGKRSHARFCGATCKARIRRVRIGAGSRERRLNKRDAFDQIRHKRGTDPVWADAYNAERLFPEMPGTAADADDVNGDDDASRVRPRQSAYGSRFVSRCVQCGARTRDRCDCGAPRRLLPAWDSNMAAEQAHSGESSPPQPIKGDSFWRAVQTGAKLVSRDRNHRVIGPCIKSYWVLPEDDKSLRAEIEQHHRRQQERTVTQHEAEVMRRLERIERQNEEILVRLGDDKAVSAVVDRFISDASLGCGVRVFADSRG